MVRTTRTITMAAALAAPVLLLASSAIPAGANIVALHVSNTSLAIGDIYTSSATDDLGGEQPMLMAPRGALDPVSGSAREPLTHALGCDAAVCTQQLVQGMVYSALSSVDSPLFTTQICNDESVEFRIATWSQSDEFVTLPASLTDRCRTLSGHVFDEAGNGKPDVFLWIEVQVPNNYLHFNSAFVVPTFVPNGNSAWYPNASTDAGVGYPLIWGFVAKTDAAGVWSATVPNVVDGAKLNPSIIGGDACYDAYFDIHAPPSCGDYLGYAVAPFASLLTGHGGLTYIDNAGNPQSIDSKIVAQRGESSFVPFYYEHVLVQAGDVGDINFTEVPPPSLEITAATLDPPDVHTGDEVDLTVTAHNNGTQAVTSVGPSISFGGSDAVGSIFLGDPVSATLAPDESIDFHYSFQALHAELLVAARLHVSGSSTLTGRSVTSAVFAKEFEITGSDFAVALAVDPAAPEPGQPFTVIATITNLLTGQDFTDLIVTSPLTAKPPSGVVIGPPVPATIASLPADGTPVTIRWTVTGVSGRIKLATTIGAKNLAGNLVTQGARTTVSVGMPQLSWEIEPRFTTGEDIADTSERANPTEYWFRATIKKADGSDCDTTFGVQFKIGGGEIAASQIAGDPCTYRFKRPNTDAFTLDLELSRDFEVVDNGSVDIEGKDLLIASLGDSLSSGEGVPDGVSGWTLAQCDRSINGGSAQAALQIEESDPHTAVTFVHLACSGATSTDGLLGTYAGIRPAMPPRSPQIADLRRIAGQRKIDAVVLSIGINDIKFSEIVIACFGPDSDCGGRQAELGDSLAAAVSELPASYASIGSELSSMGVDAANVFLLEYPDPSRDENQNYCTGSFSDYGAITSGEWAWMYDHLLAPLNEAGVAGAGANGWKSIGGLASAFSTHGLCSSDTWMTLIGESFALEGDKNGSFHPNYVGHGVYASYIYSALRDHLLAGSGDNSELPTQVEFDTVQGTVQIEVSNDRFNIGDKVTINPGAPNQESRRIVGKGSLIFDAPLNHDHQAFEPIVLSDSLPAEVTGNHAPITYDDEAAVSCHAPTFIDVIANDLDIDEGDRVSLSSADSPNAQLFQPAGLDHAGILYYATGPDFAGETFTYAALDLMGAITHGVVTVAAAIEDPCEPSSTTTLPAPTTTLAAETTTSTTTTTLASVTTTTLLPPRAKLLAGSKLVLRDKPGAPAKRGLSVSMANPTLGLGAGGPDDPALAGAHLEVDSTAGGFDSSYPLPAANWTAVVKRGVLRGWIYRDKTLTAGPIALVSLKSGKVLKISGKGAGLTHDLAGNPAVVRVRLEIGGGQLLYCARFGGTTVFRAGVVFGASRAPEPQPTQCAP